MILFYPILSSFRSQYRGEKGKKQVTDYIKKMNTEKLQMQYNHHNVITVLTWLKLSK